MHNSKWNCQRWVAQCMLKMILLVKNIYSRPQTQYIYNQHQLSLLVQNQNNWNMPKYTDISMILVPFQLRRVRLWIRHTTWHLQPQLDLKIQGVMVKLLKRLVGPTCFWFNLQIVGRRLQITQWECNLLNWHMRKDQQIMPKILLYKIANLG